MAVELVAGAILAELLAAVKVLGEKIIYFKPILKSIESSLEKITPRLDHITRLNQSRNESGDGNKDLVDLVHEGKELVDKCSKVTFLNKIHLSKLLIEYDEKLKRYFKFAVPMQLLEGVEQILVNQQKNDNVDSIKKPAQEIAIKLWHETSSSSVPMERSIVSICARDLEIKSIENGQYWKWSSITETSSNLVYEVAELLKVWHLHVRGFFGTETLLHGIQYKLVFEVMLIDSASGWKVPVKLKLILPDGSVQQHEERFKSKPRNQWLEITAGNFTMSPSTVGTIEFSLEEDTNTTKKKKGILIKGVVITKVMLGESDGKELVDKCSKVDHVLQLDQSKDIKQISVNQQKKDNVDSIKKPAAQEIPIKLGHEASSSSVPVEESTVSICARDLTIKWIENDRYWKWSSKLAQDNLVYEVVELLKVPSLHVQGFFGTETLQHGIQHKVVFEVMLLDSASGWKVPVKLKLILPDGSVLQREERFKSKPRNQWLEITVGNFTMSPSTVGTIVFSLEEDTITTNKKRILIKGAVITKAL